MEKFNNQKLGFGLIEVLIAVVILALGLTTFLKFQSTFTNSMVANREVASRDNVFSGLESTVRVPALLRASRAQNPATSQYNICINGTGGPNGCTTTNAANPGSFNLIDQTLQLVAGTGGAPIGYTLGGEDCSPSASCPLQATALFVAMCPGGAATCQTATALSVGISLVASPTGHTTAPLSNRSTARFHTVTMRQVLGLATSLVCPLGDLQYAYGIDASGNLMCNLWPVGSNPTHTQCGPNQVQFGNNPDGSAQCRTLNFGVDTCHFPNYMVGIDSSGNPACRPLKPLQRCVHPSTGLPFLSQDVNCEGQVKQASDYVYVLLPGS